MKIERTYDIHEQDLDFSGTLRPTALLATMLEKSGQAADTGGFGVQDVLPQGYTWVISRLSVQIKGSMAIGSTGRFTTWIHDCEGVATTRYIRLTDQEGREVAAFASNWSLIDLKTRRPAHLTVLPQLEQYREDDQLDTNTVRIENTTQGDTVTHRVGYNDIDFNRHANSIRYVEWMLGMYDRGFWETHRLERMDLNYLREGHWGDEVTITRQNTPGYDLFDLVIDGKSICKARLTWKPLEQL